MSPSPSPAGSHSVRLPAFLTSLLSAEYRLYRAVTAILVDPAESFSTGVRLLLERQRHESDASLTRLAGQIGIIGGDAIVNPNVAWPNRDSALAGLRDLQRGLIARLHRAVTTGLDIFDEHTPDGLLSGMHASHAGAAARLDACRS